MKTLNNTVIANRKKGDWPIIKKYFEDRGVYTICWNGDITEQEYGRNEEFYYGVIKGKFSNWYLDEAEQANATILEVSDIVSDTVTLPKSFVIEAHKSVCSDLKKRIEEVVPELFPKNELIVGKWYKFTGLNWLGFIGKDFYYGFNNGNWFYDSKYCFGFPSRDYVPATEQEVFEALKNEAVKRYKTLCKIQYLDIKETWQLLGHLFDFYIKENTLYENTHKKQVVFKDGKWAEIISDPIPQELESLISKLGKDKILEYLKD